MSIVSLVQFTLGSLHWPDFCDGMSSKTGSLSSCWLLRQSSQYKIKDSSFGFRFWWNVIFQLGLIPSFSVAFVSWDPILMDMYRDLSDALYIVDASLILEGQMTWLAVPETQLLPSGRLIHSTACHGPWFDAWCLLLAAGACGDASRVRLFWRGVLTYFIELLSYSTCKIQEALKILREVGGTRSSESWNPLEVRKWDMFWVNWKSSSSPYPSLPFPSHDITWGTSLSCSSGFSSTSDWIFVS
jgi:hypothetical protein